MEERFEELLDMALGQRATDVHLPIYPDRTVIQIRGLNGLVSVEPSEADERLFNYLQFRSNMDLTEINRPQSGSFALYHQGRYLDFRFACIVTRKVKSGVLRILNCHEGFSLDELTYDKSAMTIFDGWLERRNGLILFTGLTGSGKTTTMYSLLSRIRNRTIYSLEDPIEAVHENMIQLEINEKIGFSYDEGIKQILRHNPDIIMIGEIRDEKAARMTVRAALTGCLVVTSLHARSTTGAIYRLLELGVDENHLFDSLLGIVNQRLCPLRDTSGYTCVYDILTGEDLERFRRDRNIEVETMERKLAIALENEIIR